MTIEYKTASLMRLIRINPVGIKASSLPLPPLNFFLYQHQFPSGLACHRGIFLGSSHKIRYNILYRPIRQIFGGIKSEFSEVEGYIISHAIQLGELQSWIVVLNFLLFGQVNRSQVAAFALRSDTNKNMF